MREDGARAQAPPPPGVVFFQPMEKRRARREKKEKRDAPPITTTPNHPTTHRQVQLPGGVHQTAATKMERERERERERESESERANKSQRARGDPPFLWFHLHLTGTPRTAPPAGSPTSAGAH